MGESWIAVSFIRVFTLNLFVLSVELEPFLFSFPGHLNFSKWIISLLTVDMCLVKMN